VVRNTQKVKGSFDGGTQDISSFLLRDVGTVKEVRAPENELGNSRSVINMHPTDQIEEEESGPSEDRGDTGATNSQKVKSSVGSANQSINNQ